MVDHETKTFRIGRNGDGRGRVISYARAVIELLMHTGTLPFHAGAVARSENEKTTVFIGPSGAGKSSLTWLALRHNWMFLSDDHLGLQRATAGHLEIVPLKRSLAVSEALLDRLPADAKREDMLNGSYKARFDPENFVPGRRLKTAVPGALVFLARGDKRNMASLHPSDAFTRLLGQSAAATPSGRKLVPLLKEFVDTVPSKEAVLTRECLEDPHVLEELGA